MTTVLKKRPFGYTLYLYLHQKTPRGLKYFLILPFFNDDF